MSSRWALRVSERVYQMLLVAYPKGFHDAYGPHMTQVFRDKYREAVERAGALGLVALWARTVLDLLSTAFAERRSASAPTGSRLERVERTLERAQLLGSPWRARTSRSWAVGAIFFGILNVALSGSMLLYGDRNLSGFGPLNSLAIGLCLACQGAGYLLRARSETFARLLRVGAVLVFSPVVVVCAVALMIGLFEPVGALWRAANVLTVALLLYGIIKLLPSRWQARLFGGTTRGRDSCSRNPQKPGVA